MARVILHVDLDYFYAQCEELRNPGLGGKPVVVCIYSGRTQDSGAVSTANYKARELGIKSGIPIFQAKRAAGDSGAVFISADKPYYWTISERIMGILRSHADSFEQVSVDEAYLDITKKVDGSFDFGREIAFTIKKEIFEKENLTCSVGIGPNKLVAKMAASYSKPDGLTLVSQREAKDFLSPMKVKKLHGIGPKTESRLNEMGIHTIKDLSEYNPPSLVENFGRKFGVYLHEASNAVDNSPVVEREREQISRIVTLKEDTHNIDDLVPVIESVSKEVKTFLDKESKRYKTVSIILINEDLVTKTRSKTIESHSDSLETIIDLSKQLLSEFLGETDKKLRRFGVSVSGFEEKSEQKDLSSFLK